MAEEKYNVKVPIKGYTNSTDAYLGKNEVYTVKAGEYKITSEVNSMIQLLTSDDGYSVYWINPSENDEKANQNNTNQSQSNQVDPSNTGTTSGYDNGENKDKKLEKKNPKFVSGGVKDEVECYIINLITDTRINLGLPSDLSDNFSAQFDPVEIRGRSTPLQGYDSSGPRQVSFSTTLYDDYCEEGLYNRICKLKALVFPLYTSYVVAPVCLLRLGKAVSMIGIVGNVGISYSKPYRDGMYVQAEVSIDFTEVLETPYDAHDIENGGGMG